MKVTTDLADVARVYRRVLAATLVLAWVPFFCARQCLRTTTWSFINDVVVTVLHVKECRLVFASYIVE